MVPLSIFPNPSSGIFNMNFSDNVTGNLHIYNTTGVLMSSSEIIDSNRQSLEINKSDVFITTFIQKNGKIVSKKIIVIN